MNGMAGMDNTDNITKQLYTLEPIEGEGRGLVFITWKVPVGITAGPAGPKNLQLMVSFSDGTKTWLSNTYSQLNVGETLVNGNTQQPEDWDLFKDYVTEVIEEYFSSNNFVIDAN